MYIYICVYIYLPPSLSIYTHTNLKSDHPRFLLQGGRQGGRDVSIYLSIYLYIYIYIYIYIYRERERERERDRYIYIYIYIYIYMYIYMYTCVYIYRGVAHLARVVEGGERHPQIDEDERFGHLANHLGGGTGGGHALSVCI